MNLPLFLAKRIFTTDGDQHQVSRPAVRIATLGVAIGLAVMIITVSVILGFKHTIRDKVVGFGSHIQVQNMMSQQSGNLQPISLSDTLLAELRATPNVRHVALYSMTQGILKTDDDFMGVAFKGIGKDYDTAFLRDNLREGALPAAGEEPVRYDLLVSQKMADKLRLRVGDKVYAYFFGFDDVRARRFIVCGIYQSNMKKFDETLCFTDFRIPVRLNNWEKDQCGGAEILVDDFDRLAETADSVTSLISQCYDTYGKSFTSQTIHEAYPQIFSWLSLLDINVWIILALMVCVAGFTMISGLLIIILERTQMIGVLKALGMRNQTVRHTFLWFAVFIIGRGLLLGNLAGVGLVALQQLTGIVSLDPNSYYVETAPVELNIPIIIALNLATLIISVLVLVAPSFLISHIEPARSMRYE